ncbi:MAG: type II toxin-antitoxin system prevent-host-death family antitoxin [Thermomicrobiales bacterium]
MATTKPGETRANLSDTKQQLSKFVNQVAEGRTRLVVEKSGLPVVAIISNDDYLRLVEMETERERRFTVLQRLSDSLADVPTEELEAEVSRAIAATRARKHSGSAIAE